MKPTHLICLALLGSTKAGELAPCGWKCSSPCIDKSWICDGYEQCDDNSDEGKTPGEGCNLFPESGCPSSMGLKHYKCERTGECFDTESDAEECEVSSGPPKHRVCDGTEHCEDGSD